MAQDRGRERWVDESERTLTLLERTDPNHPEVIAHRRELNSRLAIMSRAANEIPADKVLSVEWRQEAGRYWSKARIGDKRQLAEVAAEMGLSSHKLRAIDAGMVRIGEVVTGVFENYAKALGKPELYTDFKRDFHSSDWHTRLGVPLSDYDPRDNRRSAIEGVVPPVVIGALVGIAGAAAGAAARSITRRIRG